MRARTFAALVVASTFASAFAFAEAKPPAKAAAKPAPKKIASRISAAVAWHTPTPGKKAPTDEAGRPMLAFYALNTREQVALEARSEHGGFAAEDLDRAARLLREPGTGNEHPVDPHVLDLVYRIQLHFSAHEVRVISGYRTPRKGGTSNHGRGRAIDLVVPGAADEEVATFVRAQGFCGVGVYPVSGFVHVDVRDRSFFWVDTSGPRQRSRTRGILADLAARSDREALARGEHAALPFSIGVDVDASVADTAPPSAEDDDTDLEVPDHDHAPVDAR